MKYSISVLLMLILFYSCNKVKTKSSRDNSPIELKITPIYYNKVCQGDSCSYVHYLNLSSYNRDKFNDYDFVYIADKYLDSVQTNLPVSSIEFSKPFNFENIGGSENHEQLNEHGIVSLWYESNLNTGTVPEINSISIWVDGERKSLKYLLSSVRTKRMEYYRNNK